MLRLKKFGKNDTFVHAQRKSPTEPSVFIKNRGKISRDGYDSIGREVMANVYKHFGNNERRIDLPIEKKME